MDLSKSLEDGAPFLAFTPQIGSVLEVLGRVLAVLRKTFEDGARTPTSSPGGLKFRPPATTKWEQIVLTQIPRPRLDLSQGRRDARSENNGFKMDRP